MEAGKKAVEHKDRWEYAPFEGADLDSDTHVKIWNDRELYAPAQCDEKGGNDG
jgi:hypothetical protein